MSNPAPFIPPVMTDVIIDLYHGDNINVDFAVVKAGGIAAVILKATQGSGFIDPAFASRLADARTAEMLVGAYHFMDGTSPVEQVAHFLSVVGNTDDVLLALDFEANEASQASVTQVASAVNAVKAVTGRFPVLYSNRFMLTTPNPILSQCSLWLAEYGSNPICPPGWSEWKLWQYTDGQLGIDPKPVPGIGPCDRSRFAGTVAELTAWWPMAQLAVA